MAYGLPCDLDYYLMRRPWFVTLHGRVSETVVSSRGAPQGTAEVLQTYKNLGVHLVTSWTSLLTLMLSTGNDIASSFSTGGGGH